MNRTDFGKWNLLSVVYSVTFEYISLAVRVLFCLFVCCLVVLLFFIYLTDSCFQRVTDRVILTGENESRIKSA